MQSDRMSGERRPRTSLIGPATSWPRASPSKQDVRLSCVIEAVVFSSSASFGNAGKYISSESGPKADKLPRMNIAFIRAEGDKGRGD
ncbi:hypothetical protein D3C77_540680 [compost metagenome]